MQMLDPKVINLWRLQGFIRFLFFEGPILSAGAFYLARQFGPWSAALVGLLALLSVVRLLLWPGLTYDFFHYQLQDSQLLVERGVLFRSTTCIPLDRIQHIDTNQGALERAFGLFRVVVYTASGLSADAIIPGLSHEKALELRTRMASVRGNDGV
jgi:membrane protein YdbS with pleckstrin-like domain